MADVYGAGYTNAFNDSPRVNVEAADAGGRVRCIFDTYEASALASGSVIYMGGQKVPAGGRIVDAWMDSDALGASVSLTLKVGSTTIAAKSAGTSAALTRPAAGQIQNVTVSSESDVTITTGSNAATGTITCAVFYMLD